MQNKEANNRGKLYSCIRQVRDGDQAAFAALLSDYEPLIGAEVAHHSAELSAQDVEDLRQSALIAFYRAALNFDLSQNEVEFGLYAKICISNALVSQLRVIRRYYSEISVGDTWSHSEGGEDPATRLMEEEAAAVLFARVRALLSPFENRVWSLYVAGRPVKEIARLLQKDTHSIENAVYRIRKKLRTAFENGLRD
ncbi:MAG: sigma-70 family RNA polymerase sigma factor [Ruminococcaceae bacterium]|nr:sigma-70 family RNA polymerase sigma factor [Oscillospiraceae bacterium]